MTTDISEKGLETLIMRHMTGTEGLAFAPDGIVAETPDAQAAAKAAGSGWLAGNPKDYDRTHTLDVPQLFSFLHATQPDTGKKLGIADYKDAKDINRQKFLARLSNEIGKRGVIDVLRKGVDHGPLHLPVLRHALAGQREGGRPPCAEPFQRHAPVALQHGRDAPGAGPGPVHQRPAPRYI